MGKRRVKINVKRQFSATAKSCAFKLLQNTRDGLNNSGVIWAGAGTRQTGIF